MENLWGAMGDGQFWKDWGSGVMNYGQAVKDRVNYLTNLPAQADAIAEQKFPGYDRDSSTKNAFRHALGTGMLAQELGNSLGGSVPAKAIGASLAKIAGYGWEAPTLLYPGTSGASRTDSLHDLNANAEGASAAMNAADQADLIQALESMARGSVQAKPPAFYQYGPGYLTRTGR